MLTVLLATTTSALFGVGDFLGGVASRRDSAIAVTATAHAVGLASFALAVLLFPAPVSRGALWAGAAAGVCGGIGVVALYAALALGRMSIVAPITAALSGSLPALFDVVRGTAIGVTGTLGLGLALAATVIVSASPSPGHTDGDESGLGDAVATPQSSASAMPPSALGLSLLAGIAFSGSFLSFSFAGAHSGFWPLLSARAVSVLMLGALALARRGRLGVATPALRTTLGAGVFDAAANVTMINAIRIGPLAIASVLGSLYPVVTILLARVVLKERMARWQRLGVVLALVAVVLTSLPR